MTNNQSLSILIIWLDHVVGVCLFFSKEARGLFLKWEKKFCPL